MKLLFLCEACGAVSTLNRPALNSVVLFVAGAPLFFAPTFYSLASMLPATLGWLVQILLVWLGAAAVACLGVLLVGRFTQKYIPLNDGDV
jgi:hypothetical protein